MNSAVQKCFLLFKSSCILVFELPIDNIIQHFAIFLFPSTFFLFFSEFSCSLSCFVHLIGYSFDLLNILGKRRFHGLYFMQLVLVLDVFGMSSLEVKNIKADRSGIAIFGLHPIIFIIISS